MLNMANVSNKELNIFTSNHQEPKSQSAFSSFLLLQLYDVINSIYPYCGHLRTEAPPTSEDMYPKGALFRVFVCPTTEAQHDLSCNVHAAMQKQWYLCFCRTSEVADE